MDTAPAIEIVITKTERHDVRAEAVERVARQLCAAAGCDPDGSIQCSTPVGLISNCTLMHLPYPTDRNWYAYNSRAEKILKDAFK